MFNGVKVYLEKELQISLEKITPEQVGESRDDDMFGSVVEDIPDVSGKEVQKYEKVWLKMSKKHQFKYYLDSDDSEEIKTQEALNKEKDK